MPKHHHYRVVTIWTGNLGPGTRDYRAYTRDHTLTVPGKTPPLAGSADPAFRGDPARYNPEELFLASLSACHMLWYLHLASVNGITVVAYEDGARGTMVEGADGAGRFASVTLAPRVTIAEAARTEDARDLHHEAGRMCFIANSVSVPITYEGEILLAKA